MAQRVGHVNTGLILQEMPEVNQANADIEKLQADLLANGEKMVMEFQAEYEAVVAEKQSGNLTPVQEQQKQESLQQKQAKIQAYQQEVQAELIKKREELYRPILDRLDKVIADMGKEGDFLFIFDTAVPNVILFAEEPLDLTDEVRKRLGD